MFFTEGLIYLLCLGGIVAATKPHQIIIPKGRGCGEVTIFYTGFPAYHPLVIEQGYDPVDVDVGFRNETAVLLKMGYNMRVHFAGTERPIAELKERMGGIKWDITGIGYGQRGAVIPDIVTRFEDNLIAYREVAPWAPTVFNWNPFSTVESVVRRAPLAEKCTNKPGRFYGYEEACDPSLCKQTRNITDPAGLID